MSGMKERLTLVREWIDPDDPHQRVTRQTKTVFADKRPQHGGEFHAAGARGFDLQHIMRMRAQEYDQQRIAIYKGQEYTIYRARDESNDWVELFLSTKGASAG